MRIPLAALGLAALAGCAAPLGAPNPERVSLIRSTLTVHFADGSQCRADIAAAPAGRLADCAQPMEYAVVLHHDVWVKEAAGFLEPYATITLTRPGTGLGAGRQWVWQTPQPESPGREG